MKANAQLFFVLIAFLISTSASKSQILTNLTTWSFLGQPGDQVSTPFASVASGVSATDIARSVNVSAHSGTNSMNSTNWSTAPTIDLGKYYEFGLTAEPGFTLSLTSLVIGMTRTTAGPANFAVRSSLDSFASDIFTGLVPTNVVKITNNFGLEFENLSGPVDFRVYGYNATGVEGRFRLLGSPVTSDSEALVITGTAVPEPSSAILIGVSFATLLVWTALRGRRRS